MSDSDGTPIVGATVLIQGTSTGAITDAEGRYSFKAPEGVTLEVSSVGYVTQLVPVGNQTVVNIVMESDALAVDDVVVVGYGTMEKREVTSSITTVKNKDMIPGATSPIMALQGKVTGLSIVSSSGTDPNSDISLQLRGSNSVNASQGPLVVVDGIAGADMTNIPREDIVSIDVLKDASAAAIYGTRASGGVILVTTKRASEGPVTVSYSTELSTETIRRKADVLTAEEFLAHGQGQDYGYNTDWFDLVTKTPFNHRHTLSMSGGTDKFNAYSSFTYRSAEGVAIGSDRQTIGGRINVNYKAFDGILELGANVSYYETKSNNTDNSIFNQAMKNNPTQTAFDPDDVTGYNVWTGGYDLYNPVADIMLREDIDLEQDLQASFTAKLNITKKLNTQVTLGVDNNEWRDIYWRSAQHRTSRSDGIDGYAYLGYGNSTNVMFDWIANYNNKWGKHSLGAMAGYSFQEFNGEGFSAENSDFSVDGVEWNDLSSGSFLTEGRASMDSWKDPRTRLIAFFGRANYNYDDRFMMTATVRYEGSSKFADGNKWGVFPAISAGWRISNEQFMQNADWVSDLRVRAGWGRTGNEGFDPGVSTRMYSSDGWWYKDGEWILPYGLSSNVNTDLVWETKDEINVGVDFSLLKNRLSGKFDWYNRKSSNLIYSISVSQPPAVHDSTVMNVGDMTNTGFEFELTGWVVRQKDIDYTTTVRVSKNTNTLNSLWGSQTYWDQYSFPSPGNPGTAVRLSPGEKIGRFYLWKHAGISDDGQFLIYNKDGDIIPSSEKTDEDKQFIGNAIPKVMLSWDNSFRYKRFDLDLYFRAWIGYDVFNMSNMYYGLANVSDQNVLSSAYGANANISSEKELTDYWLEKGDFLKLDALTLGYNFNVSKMEKYVKNIRAFVTIRDVFCLTGYTGLDPEVNINGLTPGFEELSAYPETRTFLLGAQFTF